MPCGLPDKWPAGYGHGYGCLDASPGSFRSALKHGKLVPEAQESPPLSTTRSVGTAHNTVPWQRSRQHDRRSVALHEYQQVA
jgi:hypothetical protein